MGRLEDEWRRRGEILHVTTEKRFLRITARIPYPVEDQATRRRFNGLTPSQARSREFYGNYKVPCGLIATKISKS